MLTENLHYFAGVLAGELFGAESKGQVYGHLHAYLFDNESSLSTLSSQCMH